MSNPGSKVRDISIALAVIATVVLLGLGGYFLYSYGKSVVQKDFDNYKSAQELAYTKLQNKYDQLSDDLNKQSAQNTEDIKNANQEHQNALAANSVEYGKRLLASEARAKFYQSQAQSGTTQCGDLASYAARLDSSLEEGRYVVRDLRATLGQRDETIRILGKELMATRQLIEAE